MPAKRTLLTGPPGAAIRDRTIQAAKGDRPGPLDRPVDGSRRCRFSRRSGRKRGRLRDRSGSGAGVTSGAPSRERRDDVPGPAWRRGMSARSLAGRLNLARRQGDLDTTAGMAHWPGFRRRLFEHGSRPGLLQERSLEGRSRVRPSWKNGRRSDTTAQSSVSSMRRIPAGFVVLGLAGSRRVASPRRAPGEHDHAPGPGDGAARDSNGPCGSSRSRPGQCGSRWISTPTLRSRKFIPPPLRAVHAGSKTASRNGHSKSRPVVPRAWSQSNASYFETTPTDAHVSSKRRASSFSGAPQGEGLGLIVAREVRQQILDGPGTTPDDVLVLFRRWDEDAEVVADLLRSWQIPISTPGRPRMLRTDPTISALRMACKLPREGWETSALVALLRHGQFQPRWAGSA